MAQAMTTTDEVMTMPEDQRKIGMSFLNVSLTMLLTDFERLRDFEISGRRSHGGAEARRKQREEPTTGHKGNWRVPCPCLCVETPVVAHRCFALPRSPILCGCINVPGRQANAVWGRYPTRVPHVRYMSQKKGLEFIGGSSTKSLPPSS
jgi:hypothetical protein